MMLLFFIVYMYINGGIMGYWVIYVYIKIFFYFCVNMYDLIICCFLDINVYMENGNVMVIYLNFRFCFILWDIVNLVDLKLCKLKMEGV